LEPIAPSRLKDVDEAMTKLNEVEVCVTQFCKERDKTAKREA